MKKAYLFLLVSLISITVYTNGKDEAVVSDYEKAPQIIDVSYTNHDQNIIKYDINVEDNEWSRYIYDRIGLRYKPIFTQSSSGIQGYYEKVKMMIVAGEEFDIFRADYPWQWMGSGALGQFNDQMAEYGPNILKTIPEDSLKTARIKGELMGIPVPEYAVSKHILMVRKDWLDKLGLDIPVTLADYEEFFEGIKNTDMDGNGKLDEYALSLFKSLGELHKFAGGWGFAYFNDEGTYVDFNKREIVFWAISNEARQYYQTMAKWFKNGYIDPDSITQDGTGMMAKISNGKVGILSTYIRSAHIFEKNIFETTGNMADVVPLPPIRAVTQAGYHSNFPADRVFAIYGGSDKIIESIKFLDFLCTEEGMTFTEYGIEGKDFDMVNGKPVLRSWDDRNQGMYPTLNRFGPMGKDFFWERENESTRKGYSIFNNDESWINNRMKQIEAWHEESIPDWGVQQFQLWHSYIDTSSIPEYQMYPDYLGPQQEYRLKFLTGIMDAGNDADWNEYLLAMESSGLNAIMKASAKAFFEYYDSHKSEFK